MYMNLRVAAYEWTFCEKSRKNEIFLTFIDVWHSILKVDNSW